MQPFHSPQIFGLNQIMALDPDLEKRVIEVTRQALVDHASGRLVTPPIGYLGLTEPYGDVHIKFGYHKDQRDYVIKVASGVYEHRTGQPPESHGLMMVFSRETTALRAILLEDGHLTALRTAAACALATGALTREGQSIRVGIVGTGRLAVLIGRFLKTHLGTRNIILCGRDESRLARAAEALRQASLAVDTTFDIDDLLARNRVVVTATASRQPLFNVDQVRPGTHITAVGCDGPGKQELPPRLFERARLVTADSLAQAADHGDAGHAIRSGSLAQEKLIELGRLIDMPGKYTFEADDITVADLTGIAGQDIAIAGLYAEQLRKISASS